MVAIAAQMLTWVLTLLAAVIVNPGIVDNTNIGYHDILQVILANEDQAVQLKDIPWNKQLHESDLYLTIHFCKTCNVDGVVVAC